MALLQQQFSSSSSSACSGGVFGTAQALEWPLKPETSTEIIIYENLKRTIANKIPTNLLGCGL